MACTLDKFFGKTRIWMPASIVPDLASYRRQVPIISSDSAASTQEAKETMGVRKICSIKNMTENHHGGAWC
jgi:hypothetical protein